jgi:transcriptional regulator with XRE-family HTH domain
MAKARRDAERRFSRKVEQAEVADRLGVSRALVSRWERDLSEPSAKQVLAWADATGVDPAWLLGLPVPDYAVSESMPGLLSSVLVG